MMWMVASGRREVGTQVPGIDGGHATHGGRDRSHGRGRADGYRVAVGEILYPTVMTGPRYQ